MSAVKPIPDGQKKETAMYEQKNELNYNISHQKNLQLPLLDIAAVIRVFMYNLKVRLIKSSARLSARYVHAALPQHRRRDKSLHQ